MVNIARNIAANFGLGLRYAFMFRFRKVAISKGDSTGISSFTVSQLSTRTETMHNWWVCMHGTLSIRIRYGP